ncbi:MAG: glycosyltransferase family 117 protein [Brevinematia bacterium]
MANISNPLISVEMYENYQSYSYRLRDFFIGLGVFVIVFINYILNLTPSVAAGDHGELATTTYSFGAPHPSGYPLFAILGKFFTYFPFGNIAYRVNLMSAFAGAATTFVFFFLALKILGITRKPDVVRDTESLDLRIYIPAILGSLMLGFSNLLWNQSIIGEVYSLNSFLNGITLIVFMLWYEDVVFNYYHTKEPYLGSRYLMLLFFVMGLSLTDHHLSGGYIVPISVLVVVVIFSALWGKVKFSWDELLTTKYLLIGGLVISLLIAVILFYYYGWRWRGPITPTNAYIITLAPFIPIAFAGLAGYLFSPNKVEDKWVKGLLLSFFWGMLLFMVPIIVFYGYLWIRSVAIYSLPDAEVRIFTWGEIRSLDVLWTHILRKQYGGLSGTPLYYNLIQLWDLVKINLQQFHLLLYLLLIPGIIGLFKKDINFGFSLLFIWLVFVVLFAVSVQGEPVERSRAFWSVFLIQSYFVVALFITQGMQTTMDWVGNLFNRRN